MIMLVWWISSCTYTNVDSVYIEPSADSQATISVVTSLDADTLVSAPTITDTSGLQVIFEVEVNNGELYQIGAYFMDTTLYLNELWQSRQTDTLYASFIIRDSFEIPPTMQLEQEIHTLYLDFYFSSNSNSLGDIYALEAVLYPVEYDIIVKGGQP
jgi:hypothetical protein